MHARYAVGVAAAALLVGGCASSGDQHVPERADAPRLDPARCDAPTPVGDVDRSAYGLRYTRGTMRIRVEPTDAEARCVEFAKSGNPSVEVPPDTLLFTFAGTDGEGGQFEFLASALTGGRVPGSPPAPKLTAPIPARVGVSVDGLYYSATACSLTLTRVGAAAAAGRFDCPEAVADDANPFAPSDDVPYDEAPTPTAPPATARLSGRFEVQA
ncbi:hypothetical protein [Gordonia humi]|uniref:Lipoprotein n=1 Tax=Gordonia humi TaxID=686429 RepID=A0A840EYF7_9ACTN|nr:hypothetical protein [Gordonia humi]MBB4135358.1 hypothetical protein [Gordonia humi]